MGPQHPSTHGVLRLILEMEGESVTEARCGIGYLHTGIEKNMEFRTWTQGVTFCTRMDYLSPLHNETTYCLGVERLLDIEDQIPEKANVLRVLMMELNRISSHLVCIATGGHGDRGPDGDDHRLPGAGEGAGRPRADHRTADEPRLHPARRGGSGPAAERPAPPARSRVLVEEAPAGVRRLLQRQPDLHRPAVRASVTSIWPAAWPWGSAARPCAPPATTGTCARSSPTAATRRTTSRSRPGTPATRTGGSGSG